MEIKRPKYLQQLIDLRHNGMVKVITGVRRCGKSYLLFNLFANWLVSNGVDAEHIIKIDLENRHNMRLRDPDALLAYIDGKLKDNNMHYVMIDEVQMVPQFEDVLNSYLKMPNVDIYVTGSNARLLSKDVITEFRGRGFEVRVHPLSFSEYFSTRQDTTVESCYMEYSMYGGMPQMALEPSPELKKQYLLSLFNNTYIRDIQQRYKLQYAEEMESLMGFVASSIGCITTPNKLSDTMHSVMGSTISRPTVYLYLDYIEDAFLIEKSLRYDIKGKKYFDTNFKYYFVDMGLRNACLNFRQFEQTHIMENIIYNELCVRGFAVDVGVVAVTRADAAGKRSRAQLEVDFVCNLASRRYYIQSAYRIDSDEKMAQEQASFSHINDSFKRIVILGEHTPSYHNDKGVLFISIYDFLLNDNALEW
ncbi:MAG: ATP-binding protein [Muribaculaceae bacterium]